MNIVKKIEEWFEKHFGAHNAVLDNNSVQNAKVELKSVLDDHEKEQNGKQESKP